MTQSTFRKGDRVRMRGAIDLTGVVQRAAKDGSWVDVFWCQGGSVREQVDNVLPPLLVDEEDLDGYPVVANNAMNRERVLLGTNSYKKELRFDPIEFLLDRTSDTVFWLDLCCGQGRALIEAASLLPHKDIFIEGVDLVDYFAPVDEHLPHLSFVVASLRDWVPLVRLDLVTCVHGLHYVGDKLGLIQRVVTWLRPGGRFVATLDLGDLRLPVSQSLFLRGIREQGLSYNQRTRLLSCNGRRELHLPFKFIGADPTSGPNFTGQPSVTSHYIGE
jgi:SAM-dependent methyltransferase